MREREERERDDLNASSKISTSSPLLVFLPPVPSPLLLENLHRSQTG